MEWQDEALVTGFKRHGETSVILEVVTPGHGRHLGIVKGGRSKRVQPMLQVGNSARVVWRARLEEHLGLFAVEPTVLRTATLLASAESLHAFAHVAALLRLSAERDPHPALYDAATRIADALAEPHGLAEHLVSFEAKILAETGFGLDLGCCAATGTTEDLAYVSPRSGRAVSRAAGEPYKARLLPLPAFLLGRTPGFGATPTEIRAGFRLTEFFLLRDLFGPRGAALPPARSAFLTELGKRPGWTPA
jgi:DNA repair protein RecO (recombination protein O)